MSKQRVLILDIIKHCDGHINAQELYSKAKDKMPHISVGTVYRNLGRLCEDKIIREVPLTDSASVYELMQSPHGHLVCEKCSQVKDFPITDIKELEKKLKVKILSYSCCVTHVCDKCTNN